MQFLNKIAYFLINSNLIISISGGVLTYGITHHFNIDNNSIYALIVTLLTFAVYTLQRIVDKTGFSIPDNEISWKVNPLVTILLSITSLIIAIILGLSIFNNSTFLLVLTLLFGFICSWYTLPFLGKKLREVSGIKIIVTALTWCYACAFFPLINEGVSFNNSLDFSLILMCYFIAIILPFDIRDIQIDQLSQGTIPQVIGVTATKIGGVMLLVYFTFWHLNNGVVLFENWLFYMAISSQILLLVFVNRNTNLLYFGTIDLLITLLGISYLI